MIAALALILVSCAPAGPKGTAVFRAADAPIYSSAALDAARLNGRWVQVAAFTAPGASACAAGALTFVPSRSGLQVEADLCLNGERQQISDAVISVGPGRLAIEGIEDWWIVWVDSGYRTIAIGTPSGRFGFVLDRGSISADRLNAAREVFDFNGYVTSALATF